MNGRVVSSAAIIALATAVGLVGPAGGQDNFGKGNTPQTPSVVIAPAQPATLAPSAAMTCSASATPCRSATALAASASARPKVW